VKVRGEWEPRESEQITCDVVDVGFVRLLSDQTMYPICWTVGFTALYAAFCQTAASSRAGPEASKSVGFELGFITASNNGVGGAAADHCLENL